MTQRPHDLSDLYLSPLILELDQLLAELENLSVPEIELRVALATNAEPTEGDEKSRLLLQMLEHTIETHGWKLSWAPRGLRVSHGDHALVLGVPDIIRSYREE